MSKEITKEELIKTFERGASYIHRDDVEKLITTLNGIQADVQDLQARVAAIEAKVK